MATESKSYPKLSRRLWWGVRARFAKSLPTTVTPAFISSISEMTDDSAKSNVIAPLRAMGLLNEDNTPSDLAKMWRLDEDYPQACDAIRKRVYPPELIEAYPEASAEQKDKIANWFKRNAGVGEVAAKMYADNYVLLCEKDLTAQSDSGKANGKAPSSKPVKAPAPKAVAAKAPARAATPAPAPDPADLRGQQNHPGGRRLPSIHIDVQVHISPDTTPEQIDKIFESMSRHLGSYVN